MTGLAAVAAAVALAGAGTYTTSGTTYYFRLFNGGTATWPSFRLVGPPGTTFVGGANSAETTARCVVGPADELDCGPLSPNLAPPLVHVLLVGTLAAPVPCGAPFAFYVGDVRADDLTYAGACAPPAVKRTGRTLVATTPVWSTAPAAVSYRWQLCTKGRCSAIAGATASRLAVASRFRGRSVRFVARALIDGRTVESRSAPLAVRS